MVDSTGESVDEEGDLGTPDESTEAGTAAETSTSGRTGEGKGIDAATALKLLANDRRRLLVLRLHDRREPIPIGDVASSIACEEADELGAAGDGDPPDEVYRSVYVSLQQFHLPKLEGIDVVRVDSEAKTVRPGEAFDDLGESVLQGLDGYVTERRGRTIGTRSSILGVSLFGVVVSAVASVELPVVSTYGEAVCLVLFLACCGLAIADGHDSPS